MSTVLGTGMRDRIRACFFVVGRQVFSSCIEGAFQASGVRAVARRTQGLGGHAAWTAVACVGTLECGRTGGWLHRCFVALWVTGHCGDPLLVSQLRGGHSTVCVWWANNSVC